KIRDYRSTRRYKLNNPSFRTCEIIRHRLGRLVGEVDEHAAAVLGVGAAHEDAAVALRGSSAGRWWWERRRRCTGRSGLHPVRIEPDRVQVLLFFRNFLAVG